ncbi:MAG: acyl-CoA/acyl-ACP dehydrogenase [Burkholderiaceae bacterium]|nr:acyl-CoA/acyl-ACP dehydrogenase [Microbacteriaceae bacterium]
MPILTQPLLDRIHGRAAGYDRDNAFFTDDFDELVAAGYTRALVPASLGGGGLTLAELVREQARLARAAPATALAIGMHLIWTGVAKTLQDRGDDSLDFVLREAAAGEIYAFAISEAGNDQVLFASTTVAEPRAGGYAFTGTKVFTSLSPVWTRLGTFGLDTTSPDAPKLVHGVIVRDQPGIEVLPDWDTVGMRATQSHSTRLSEAIAVDKRMLRRLDPGPNADPLVFGIFANFEILVAAVYAGIGDRALELAAAAATSRVSSATGRPRSEDPVVRWKIADAAMARDALWPRLDAPAAAVDSAATDPSADLGDQWFRQLTGLKLAATTTARFIVDQAIAVTGGGTYAASSELGRLYRDVLAGGFHPSSADSVHSTVATSILGPIPAEPPASHHTTEETP